MVSYSVGGMPVMRKLLLILALFPLSLAAQTTRTAASANESDVAAAIALSSNGDTVQIPCSGTQSVTWTSTLTISASITLTALGATPNTGPSTFGAGTNCLTIVDNVTSGWMFYLTPTYASSNNVTTIQNMNIDPISSTTALYTPITMEGTGTSSGMPQVRIDNIVFGKATQWSGSGNGSNATRALNVDNVVGVADHNTIPIGSDIYFYEGQMSSYLGVGAYGDNSWAQPDSYGTANNWFTENNLFNTNGNASYNDCTEGGPSVSESGGCRVVNRFNQIVSNDSFQITSVHGLDTTGRPRSARHTETYGNTESCSGNCQDFVTFRGGTGMVWGNKGLSGSYYWNQVFDATTYRVVYASSPWGACGGLTSLDPFDTVDNTVYSSGTVSSGGGTDTITTSFSVVPSNLVPSGAPYSVYDVTQNFVTQVVSNTTNTITVLGNIPEQPWVFNNGDSIEIIRATVCMDQSGRGQGNYISGSTPTPSAAINEALDPIYEWDDSFPVGTLSQQYLANQKQTIINRDFYTDNWKGNSLTGPAIQTSTTAPFNGTGTNGIGVGFGTLANRPSTCTNGVRYFATDQGSWNTSGNGFGSGLGYRCISGSWSQDYTPYAYPHPLISSTPQVATPTCSPTSGTPPQTVTCSVSTGGASICYTTDGSNPTAPTAGTCSGGTTATYSTALLISTNPTTLRVMGTLAANLNSGVQTYVYTSSGAAATPVFSPVSGTYAFNYPGTITTSTSGCNPYVYWGIHNPPTTGDINTNSFVINAAGTYYAMVIGCPGYTNSAVGQVTYAISSGPPPQPSVIILSQIPVTSGTQGAQ
jgi:hypothetical protein